MGVPLHPSPFCLSGRPLLEQLRWRHPLRAWGGSHTRGRGHPPLHTASAAWLAASPCRGPLQGSAKVMPTPVTCPGGDTKLRGGGRLTGQVWRKRAQGSGGPSGRSQGTQGRPAAADSGGRCAVPSASEARGGPTPGGLVVWHPPHSTNPPPDTQGGRAHVACDHEWWAPHQIQGPGTAESDREQAVRGWGPPCVVCAPPPRTAWSVPCEPGLAGA